MVSVGAKSFTELRAWQQADQLKRAVYGLTRASRVSADHWYGSQIRRAAASAPANIAEGFGRFQHADFVRFLRIAVASLDEVEMAWIVDTSRKPTSKARSARSGTLPPRRSH
jgi:four helix bundle protein